MEINISVRVKYQAQKSEMYTGMYGYACWLSHLNKSKIYIVLNIII